jgi:hypothetical protein
VLWGKEGGSRVRAPNKYFGAQRVGVGLGLLISSLVQGGWEWG